MRKNIYIDEETISRLLDLTRGDLIRPVYASESEAIRIAVERLHRFHFSPTSDATDEVLERLRTQIRMALGTVEYELMRRDPENAS